MKRLLTIHTLMLVFGVILGFSLTGCATTKIKRLSGSEFVAQAKQMEVISSFNWTTYIGSSSQRAYLEYGHPALIGSGTRTTIFWVPLSELPNDIAQQLKAGNPPWTPWNPKATKPE